MLQCKYIDKMATISLMTDKKETKATWRIPDDMLVDLKHLAIDDRTSVNTLAVQAIKDYLSKRKVYKEKYFPKGA
jgi:hypothetical protein